MRQCLKIQENSPEIPSGFQFIGDIKLNAWSRDKGTPTSAGIQQVYLNKVVRDKIVGEFRMAMSEEFSPDRGLNGMDCWNVFICVRLRLACKWSCDTVEDMANNHTDIRRMIVGHIRRPPPGSRTPSGVPACTRLLCCTSGLSWLPRSRRERSRLRPLDVHPTRHGVSSLSWTRPLKLPFGGKNHK